VLVGYFRRVPGKQKDLVEKCCLSSGAARDAKSTMKNHRNIEYAIKMKTSSAQHRRFLIGWKVPPRQPQNITLYLAEEECCMTARGKLVKERPESVNATLAGFTDERRDSVRALSSARFQKRTRFKANSGSDNRQSEVTTSGTDAEEMQKLQNQLIKRYGSRPPIFRLPA